MTSPNGAGGKISFKNLGENPPGAYLYEWFVFDNETSELESLGDEGVQVEPHITVPDADAPYLMVRIHTRTQSKAVEIFLRQETDGYEVVGIDREI